MTKLLLIAGLLFGIGACEGAPLTVVPADAGTDAQCTAWGCQDNGVSGCTLVCISHNPQPCLPGPSPCNLGK